MFPYRFILMVFAFTLWACGSAIDSDFVNQTASDNQGTQAPNEGVLVQEAVLIGQPFAAGDGVLQILTKESSSSLAYRELLLGQYLSALVPASEFTISSLYGNFDFASNELSSEICLRGRTSNYSSVTATLTNLNPTSITLPLSGATMNFGFVGTESSTCALVVFNDPTAVNFVLTFLIYGTQDGSPPATYIKNVALDDSKPTDQPSNFYRLQENKFTTGRIGGFPERVIVNGVGLDQVVSVDFDDGKTATIDGGSSTVLKVHWNNPAATSAYRTLQLKNAGGSILAQYPLYFSAFPTIVSRGIPTLTSAGTEVIFSIWNTTDISSGCPTSSVVKPVYSKPYVLDSADDRDSDLFFFLNQNNDGPASVLAANTMTITATVDNDHDGKPSLGDKFAISEGVTQGLLRINQGGFNQASYVNYSCARSPSLTPTKPGGFTYKLPAVEVAF